MIALEDAIDCLLAHTTKTEEVRLVSLPDALGRVLAEDLAATEDQPPFARAPVDGYAVRSADTAGATTERPAVLQVSGEVTAGDMWEGTIGAGEAVRIMTGAPIPAGADCTVRQEDTDYGEQKVEIYREHTMYDNFCFAGEDYKAGSCLLKAGSKLDAVSVGIAASLGRCVIRVYRRPEVAVITTGDELVLPGEVPGKGQIYNSNLFVAGARLREIGIEPAAELSVQDDAEEMADTIRRLSKRTDLIITTGGVSVGKKDIMHDVIRILGAERLFWRVGIKPGTPTLCAKYGETLLICLSGNPFGAVANIELLVRPVLARMSRDDDYLMEERYGVMQSAFPKKSSGRRFIRAIYRDGKVTLPEGLHSSGVLSSMKGCNCMIDIPAGTKELKAGDSVCVRML